MTRDEIKDVMLEALADHECKCCSVCEMTPLEHRDHHKAMATVGLEAFFQNHRFTTEARRTLKHGKRVLLGELVKHSITALLIAFAMYAALRGLKL